jgi:hypothetical protein
MLVLIEFLIPVFILFSFHGYHLFDVSDNNTFKLDFMTALYLYFSSSANSFQLCVNAFCEYAKNVLF